MSVWGSDGGLGKAGCWGGVKRRSAHLGTGQYRPVEPPPPRSGAAGGVCGKSRDGQEGTVGLRGAGGSPKPGGDGAGPRGWGDDDFSPSLVLHLPLLPAPTPSHSFSHRPGGAGGACPGEAGGACPGGAGGRGPGWPRRWRTCPATQAARLRRALSPRSPWPLFPALREPEGGQLSTPRPPPLRPHPNTHTGTRSP